ncbi:MAG: hypothetical protein AB1489_22430 [Acidobacteriota bacterium]
MRSKPTAKQKAATTQKSGRLIKLKEVKLTKREPGQCCVSVQLICKRKTIVGERTGPDEPDYQVMLAALSTIDALQKATDERLKMDLLFIERQKLEKIDREIIMVLIDVNVNDEARAATGACQVRGELIETAARAVLDATNRIVELYFE